MTIASFFCHEKQSGQSIKNKPEVQRTLPAMFGLIE
jgi:hypothetical protein